MSRAIRLSLVVGVCALGLAILTGASELGLVSESLVRGNAGTSVEGVVAGVEGTIVRVLGGNVAIDVSTARIVGEVKSTTRDATAPEAVTIAAGDRISAQVDLPTEAGRPLVARFVVVSHPRDGSISGAVQAVDAGARTVTVAGVTLAVDERTAFGGSTSRGPVTGLQDLAAGDPIAAQLLVNGTRLVALRIEAFAPPPQLATFVGTVEAIGTTSWTVSGRVVLVTAETKIVDAPAVGDQVQVVAKMGDNGALVALSIARLLPRPTHPMPTKTVVARTPPPTRTPGPGGSFPVEFKGVVEVVPPGGIGIWTISSRAVTVTSSTVVSGDPRQGDPVYVAGTMTEGSREIVALKIVKG